MKNRTHSAGNGFYSFSSAAANDIIDVVVDRNQVAAPTQRRLPAASAPGQNFTLRGTTMEVTVHTQHDAGMGSLVLISLAPWTGTNPPSMGLNGNNKDVYSGVAGPDGVAHIFVPSQNANSLPYYFRCWTPTGQPPNLTMTAGVSQTLPSYVSPNHPQTQTATCP